MYAYLFHVFIEQTISARATIVSHFNLINLLSVCTLKCKRMILILFVIMNNVAYSNRPPNVYWPQSYKSDPAKAGLYHIVSVSDPALIDPWRSDPYSSRS